ncbi:hypothetical protein DdX_12307 [Ditylenchus destructor]|uniref:C2H2-type domain-containing protein n=1 Tax=Ditylenchus destructor TaxID=166010 RepID=A0AAD4MY28_9BILA|nr:hypothetical protein DdX_12307 [Ditylenchus destructor]
MSIVSYDLPKVMNLDFHGAPPHRAEGATLSVHIIKRSHSVSEFSSVPTVDARLSKRRRANSVDAYRESEYVVTRCYISKYKKFGMVQHITECYLQNHTSNPEKYLKRCLSDIIKEAHKGNEKIEKFQMVIDAEGLQKTIWIPPRSREQNTVESILNKIQRVGKSADALNLMHAQLRIITTTFSPTDALQEYGVGSRMFNARTHYGVEERHRIKTCNEDNFCLFYALEASRKFLDHERIKQEGKNPDLWERQKFYNIMYGATFKTRKARKLLAEKVMENARISKLLSEYGLNHVKKVQEWYDQSFPGLYRIVVFDENPNLVPLWMCAERRRYTVPIYFTMDGGRGHYDAITHIAKFFKVANWCVDCQCVYNKAINHRIKCVARCPGCTGMGWGYPCPEQNGCFRLCKNCNRKFKNEKCFNNHLKNGCCRTYKSCNNCYKPYSAKESHVCGESRCRTCHVLCAGEEPEPDQSMAQPMPPLQDVPVQEPKPKQNAGVEEPEPDQSMSQPMPPLQDVPVQEPNGDQNAQEPCCSYANATQDNVEAAAIFCVYCANELRTHLELKQHYRRTHPFKDLWSQMSF